MYGTSGAARIADSEAVIDAQDAPPAAHETVEQTDEDAHGDAHENEDPDTSSKKATNGSEATQEAKNQSSSSNPDVGLPGSNLNTAGSSGQSDQNDLTRFPGRAVVKYPERNVARFLKKPATKFSRKVA